MNLEIYFNEDLHKYTDNEGNTYTSVTTLIGEYEYKFSDKEVDIAIACERIGKNPRHPKYLRYKGKSYKDILNEWKQTRDEACDIGNTKHNYLETSVKTSTGFFDFFKPKSGRLFTVKDLLNAKPTSLNLDIFISLGVKDKYPTIYKIVEELVNSGWSIYAEIGTYSYNYLISGLIDILCVKDDKFIILDWKTNKNPLRFESGYYDKDNDGNITNFITKDEKFKHPLSNLDQSVGNKYTLQLSTYAVLTEAFGFKCVGLILCHIMHDTYTIDEARNLNNLAYAGLNRVNIYKIDYLKDSVNSMLLHHSCKIKN